MCITHESSSAQSGANSPMRPHLSAAATSVCCSEGWNAIA